MREVSSPPNGGPRRFQLLRPPYSFDRVQEATMARGTYFIISETTEDRFDEAENLDDAIRIAHGLVKKSQAGDPISIEHNGRVVRQFVLTPEGVVEEPSVS